MPIQQLLEVTCDCCEESSAVVKTVEELDALGWLRSDNASFCIACKGTYEFIHKLVCEPFKHNGKETKPVKSSGGFPVVLCMFYGETQEDAPKGKEQYIGKKCGFYWDEGDKKRAERLWQHETRCHPTLYEEMVIAEQKGIKRPKRTHDYRRYRKSRSG